MADFKYKIDWVPDAKKQRMQVAEEATPQGIASRPTPTKPAKKEDDYYTKMYNIMSSYFDSDEEAQQALSSKKPDAAKAKQITMEEFERMTEASADRGRAMREDRGITQSLVEGGGEAYRTKTPEGTITRPVASPDELVTDTAKDEQESAPVTAETEGAGLMSKIRPKARPDDLNADSPINVRNNNLGNIKNIKSNDWKGQTNLGSNETFASFSSPELGVRALKKVIQANINATNTIEEYVNRYASEPKEKAYYKKNGKLMPHLKNYATQIAKSQGLDSTTASIPKDVDMLSWIKATATAEGGADALTYFTDDVIKRGLAL